MSAEVEVQVGRCRDVLAVPTEAVSVDHDRNVCYVIGPSGLERREITPGGFTPDLVEVTDGLKEGESVALNQPRDFDRSPGRRRFSRPGSARNGRPRHASLDSLRGLPQGLSPVRSTSNDRFRRHARALSDEIWTL